MDLRRLRLVCLCLFAAALGLAGRGPAAGQEAEVRLLVQFRQEVADPREAGFLASVSATARHPVTHVRSLGGGAHVLLLKQTGEPLDPHAVALRLAARPDVLFAEPDLSLPLPDPPGALR